MKRVWVVIATMVFILSMGVSFLFSAEEVGEDFWWDHIPGFLALLGFIGCVVIIVVAKLLGRYWLQRKDDYYD